MGISGFGPCHSVSDFGIARLSILDDFVRMPAKWFEAAFF
jgi:hypothetical protein